MRKTYITREIGIDMAHRVPFHASKCKSLHGHRYRIEATCYGELHKEGEQTGMVLDFGFLKTILENTIDYLCDHGTVLYKQDELVDMIYPEIVGSCFDNVDATSIHKHPHKRLAIGKALIALPGVCQAGKIAVVPFIPTAENLAEWWFELIAPQIDKLHDGKIKLSEIKVWETPNCSATYRA